jgi:hypothetical protein
LTNQGGKRLSPAVLELLGQQAVQLERGQPDVAVLV